PVMKTRGAPKLYHLDQKKVDARRVEYRDSGELCKRCGAAAFDGCGWCLDHLPDEYRCRTQTHPGKRCRLPRLAKGGRCQAHHPKYHSGGNPKTGWIYVFRTGHYVDDDMGYFKIGCTSDLQQRRQALRTSNPFGDILFAAHTGRFVGRTERFLHWLLREQRYEREIFLLSRDDLAQVYYYLWGFSPHYGQWPKRLPLGFEPWPECRVTDR